MYSPAHPWFWSRSSLTTRALTGRKKENVFNQLGMLADLMQNAGKLRESFEKAFESLGQVEVEGSAGGGSVTVKVNGRLEVVSVRIDPKLVADGDTELLEELVAAAVNAAMVKAREGAAKSLSSMTGGLPAGLFPGLGGAAVRVRRRGALVDVGLRIRGRRGSIDHRAGAFSRHRRQVRRAARPPRAPVSDRRGSRTGRRDSGRQRADQALPGLLPPYPGRPARLCDLRRPAPRSRDRVRGRAIARPHGPGEGQRLPRGLPCPAGSTGTSYRAWWPNN